MNSIDNRSMGSINRSNFKHPKIGGKIDKIFKSNHKTSNKVSLQNNSKLFDSTPINLDEGRSAEDKNFGDLEPSQTGDFPTQQEIQEFNFEIKPSPTNGKEIISRTEPTIEHKENLNSKNLLDDLKTPSPVLVKKEKDVEISYSEAESS